MQVNGHTIPAALALLLKNGGWIRPSNLKLIEVFGENPVDPLFYDIDLIYSENGRWLLERDASYIGKIDRLSGGNDISPAKSVLIGDLGPDLLIALDYRHDDPSVLYLGRTHENTWIEVAKNVDSLLMRLGFISSSIG